MSAHAANYASAAPSPTAAATAQRPRVARDAQLLPPLQETPVAQRALAATWFGIFGWAALALVKWEQFAHLIRWQRSSDEQRSDARSKDTREETEAKDKIDDLFAELKAYTASFAREVAKGEATKKDTEKAFAKLNARVEEAEKRAKELDRWKAQTEARVNASLNEVSKKAKPLSQPRKQVKKVIMDTKHLVRHSKMAAEKIKSWEAREKKNSAKTQNLWGTPWASLRVPTEGRFHRLDPVIRRGFGNRSLEVDIPKIVHQSWKTREVPAGFRNWSRSWQQCLPGWEVRVYNDTDNRRLVQRYFPEHLQFYDDLYLPIMRADFSRIMYMAIFGGIYVDLDIQCLRTPFPLFDRIGDHVTFACEACTNHSGGPSNAFFMVSQTWGRRFFTMLMDLIFTNRTLLEKAQRRSDFPQAEVLQTSGPGALEDGLKQAFGKDTNFHAYNETPVLHLTARDGTNASIIEGRSVFGFSWNSDYHMKNMCGLNSTACLEAFPEDVVSITYWTNTWIKGDKVLKYVTSPQKKR